MVDFARPLQTRDGKAVRIYAWDGEEKFCIHGAIETPQGWHIASWDMGGSFLSSDAPLPEDLVNVEVSLYVNLYEADFGYSGTGYPTKEAADRNSGPTRLACVLVHLTSKEGAGL